MTSKKKYLLYLCLFVSLSLNGLVIIFDTIPYALPKIEKRYFPPKTLQSTSESIGVQEESLIVNGALKMISSNTTYTSWSEPQGFTHELLKILRGKSSTEYGLNNYPQAFLYYGLTEYFIQTQDFKSLDIVKEKFDKYTVLSKNILRVDQVPNGLTALSLYKVYNEEKYLEYSKDIFNFVLEQIEEDGLLSYRKGQATIFPDTLGLVIPFLLKYDKHTELDAKKIAHNQMQYFINYGVNKKTYLPVHAVNRFNNIPLGSVNWGRGIGWYAIALSQLHKETGYFEKEYNGLIYSLEKIKNNDGLWGQFPGSNDNFDASATLLFMYANIINHQKKLEKFNVIDSLKDHISNDGFILETSGDTYGINRYSNTFSKSELSQGLLLLILSEVYKNKEAKTQ